MQRNNLAGLGLALLMAAAVGLRADESLAPQAPDQPPMGATAMGQDDGPGAVMDAPDMTAPADPSQAFEELKGSLGLSSDQEAKLKAIHDDARAKAQVHMKALMGLIKSLDGQVQARAADADLQATLDKIKAEHKAMQADRDAAMEQREAVLSPQQSAKFVLAVRDKMRQGMLRRMRNQGGAQGQGGPEQNQP